MTEKKLKICGYYTPDYIQYVRSFLNTYKGSGDIWFQPIKNLSREKATSIKPKMFEKCICKDYEYYVFADVDLLFKSNFCFTELCRPDSIGIIFRDRFSYPQRSVNASIITVPKNLVNFIHEWVKINNNKIIGNTKFDDIAPTNISNNYYWDQVSLNYVFRKYKHHFIDEKIYLAQRDNENVKILSPHAYNKNRKQQMYNSFLNNVLL